MGSPASPEIAEKIRKALPTNQDKIIAQTDKLVARLYEEIGTIAISRKEKLPNNISTIDSETWSQFYNILRELMEKCENTLDCHDFAIKAQIGESAYRT